MSKKFRLLMVLVMVTGLFGGLLTGSTVSADPNPGLVIEIPRIDIGDAFADEGDWDTKIQVQNVGGVAGGAIIIFWEAYSEECPSNAPGPSDHACMQLPAGGVWTLHSQIPDSAKSAIVYSVDAAHFYAACNAANVTSTSAWLAWVAAHPTAFPGPDLAVTVDRWGTDPFGEVKLSSSYTGVADPDMAGTEVFAPYVMHGYNDLDTVITIQNSGDQCTSIWIYYKMQGNCEFYKAQHIELLAPGESITVGPAGFADFAFPGTGMYEPGAGNWLGSAYISAIEPLAVVVDQLSLTGANRGTLLSMRGMPYDQALNYTWYADLLYREISGYTSSIQVQNITRDSIPTFVTVEFFDQSGDQILYVGDWVCRNGSRTFYLPAIVDLGVNFPFGYVGAAEIQSHGQIDYPGGGHDGAPIFAVVDIKKTKVYDESLPGWRHTIAGETQAGAYNAHPYDQKVNAWGWAMPFIAKEQEGVTSRIAIRNNANCNKINGNIFIRDETGRVVATIPVPWLHPKHMTVIDLAYFGQIARGFVGAATFEVGGVEQLCDTNFDGRTDVMPVMPSVVVLNYGYEKELPIGGGAGPQTTEGDLTRVYEGIPYMTAYSECQVEICGQAIQIEDLNPVKDVTLQVLFEGENSPYTLDGYGYIDDNATCDEGEPGTLDPRLSGAGVELQQFKTVSGVTGWYKVASTTTTSAGWFQFKDKLAFGGTYRVKFFVVENGNTVSYVSAAWAALGPATRNFRIQTIAGGNDLNLTTGFWCGLDEIPDARALDVNLAPANIYSAAANPLKTDSTGHFCFTYGDGAWVWDATAVPPMWVWDPDAEPKTVDPEDITLLASKTGYTPLPLTLDDVACEDQNAYFEMDLIASDINVKGTVVDVETGLPLNDVVVSVSRAGVELATVEADGSYDFLAKNIPFDLYKPLEVCAVKMYGTLVEYTEMCDSIWIPKGGEAIIDFALHTDPDSRVLLYYGNGGPDPVAPENDAVREYYDLKARYEAKGYIVDYTYAWPSDPDLEEYKLIVLILPGYDNTAGNQFNTSQEAQLGLFIHGGGRVVLLTENSTETSAEGATYPVQDALLAALSIGIDLSGGADNTGKTYGNVINDGTETPYHTEFTSEHLEGDNSRGALLTDGAFDMFENWAAGDMISADKVGWPANDPNEDTSTGWDVIVVGDAEILDDQFLSNPADAAHGWPENDKFADDLISFPH